MDDAPFVHKFKPFQYLAEEHQAGLEGEFPAAKVEQILERRAKQLLNHEYEVVLDNYAWMVQTGKSYTWQKFQVLKLHQELRESTWDWLSFDGNLPIVIVLVVCQIYLAEWTFTDFFDQLELAIGD